MAAAGLGPRDAGGAGGGGTQRWGPGILWVPCPSCFVCTRALGTLPFAQSAALLLLVLETAVTCTKMCLMHTVPRAACPCSACPASGPGEVVAAAQAADGGTGGAPSGKRRRQQQQADGQQDEDPQPRKRRRQGRDGQHQAAAGPLPAAVAAWRHHLLPELHDRAHWWPATAFSVPPHLYGLYQPSTAACGKATAIPCPVQEELDGSAAGDPAAAGLGTQEDQQQQQQQQQQRGEQQTRLALEDLFPLGRLCVPDPALLTHVSHRARVAAHMLGPHNVYTRHVACELALLQQGLLDERAVLEAYRTTWPVVLERQGAQEGARHVGGEQEHEPGAAGGPSSPGRRVGTRVWSEDGGRQAWEGRLVEEDEAIERRLLAVGAALGEVQEGVRLAQRLAERLAPAAAISGGGVEVWLRARQELCRR